LVLGSHRGGEAEGEIAQCESGAIEEGEDHAGFTLCYFGIRRAQKLSDYILRPASRRAGRPSSKRNGIL
jgi:hypothetical protein